MVVFVVVVSISSRFHAKICNNWFSCCFEGVEVVIDAGNKEAIFYIIRKY